MRGPGISKESLVRLTVALVAGLATLGAPASAQPVAPLPVRTGGIASLPGGFQVGAASPDLMAAHFINVGQGSAALFEFSCGAVLVDTGGQREAAVDWRQRFTEYLNGFFARRTDLQRTLEVVFITHPHPDHTDGIAALLDDSGFAFRHVITDAETTGAGKHHQKRLIHAANQRRIPQVQIKTSMIGRSILGLTSRYIDPLKCRGRAPDIRVLWGSYDEQPQWSKRDRENENNHSVAVRVAFGDSSFLVTGDMEERSIKTMIERYRRNIGVLNTDVYVAGHHGSRNGTTAELVRVMSPELAIVSAGDPSDREPGFAAFEFGHPNRAVIRLLADPATGVSFRRPPKRVAVGLHGRHPITKAPPAFEEMELDRAVFATGWDGNIVVVARADGAKSVILD